MFQRLKKFYFEAFFRLKRVALLILGGLLVPSASLMLVGGSMIHHATSDWPQAKGRLLKFDVHPIEKNASHVKLDVEYSYSVDQANYQGRFFSPMTRPGKIVRWRGYNRQRHYRLGDAVNVIYDPRDPSSSYLEATDWFWDIALIPVSIGALGFWMLYLFVKTRRRHVPKAIAALASDRFSNLEKWRPVIESVIERDYQVLRGLTAYSATGSLLAGWPQCRVAIVASPNEFAVIPGPFTLRGVASSVLTLALEFSLSRFWIPSTHGIFFLIEMWRRNRQWKCVEELRFQELFENFDNILITPIDDATIYGCDAELQLWYRLPGQNMDEFMRLSQGDEHVADELVAYIGLMQEAKGRSLD